jgi:hypothetical protein
MLAVSGQQTITDILRAGTQGAQGTEEAGRSQGKGLQRSQRQLKTLATRESMVLFMTADQCTRSPEYSAERTAWIGP